MQTEPLIFEKYKENAIPALRLAMPYLTDNELNKAVDYSIAKRFKDTEGCYIYNNYKEQRVDMTLSQITDYIISREPIITAYGVLFNKHANVANPLGEMIMGFLDSRAKEKKLMFKYPKGSEEYEKHNLAQSLFKIDANGSYGAQGQHTCLFYNLYVSASTTTQGRSLISSASLLFEMYLNNNCKFSSFDEVVTFITNVISEKYDRKFKDSDFLDSDVTHAECFNKLILTCGFDYIPSDEDMDVLWNMILNMSQEDINRIYYKNNLFGFMENSSMRKAVIYILQELDEPYIDPNTPPECIKPELDAFNELLMEYVYYGHQIIDRIDKYANMYRSVSIITDTDSSIISLDGWYNYVLNLTYGVDMKIKHTEVDAIDVIDALNGETDKKPDMKHVTVEEYSFYDEDVIEFERDIDDSKIIPQDGLRYSIINILAYCLDSAVNDYMVRYTQNSNSAAPDRKCLMRLKNEFLFRRVLLLASAKKNYASIQELQEGNVVPEEEALDIKGLPMNKSTLNEGTQKRLKKILYEDILNASAIDQIKVLKSIALFEKDIYNSLSSGDKTYYKPSRIKSFESYDNPMRIQGIKASILYNELKEEYMEAIDLHEINSINIIKVNINNKNINTLKDKNPEKYEKLDKLLKEKDFKGGITSIAMPVDVDTPEWLLDFIDYDTIISDNIIFPLESIGLYQGKSTYTNIVKM